MDRFSLKRKYTWQINMRRCSIFLTITPTFLTRINFENIIVVKYYQKCKAIRVFKTIAKTVA